MGWTWRPLSRSDGPAYTRSGSRDAQTLRAAEGAGLDRHRRGGLCSMLPETLGHVFDMPLRLAPSSVAVIQGDRTLTYRDLDVWCNRVANGLATLGVCTGDRVALMF